MVLVLLSKHVRRFSNLPMHDLHTIQVPATSEFSLKISAHQLLWLGIDNVLKILKERMTQSINE